MTHSMRLCFPTLNK
ncbi:erythromycin resistance leader peptide [Virgibacillus sp. SK37]